MRQPLALIGANGMLARKVGELARTDYAVHAFDLPGFDLTDGEQVRQTLRQLRPTLIVNCAAYTNVDGAEQEEALATRINGDGPGHLAAAAAELDAVLVHISTDYVFSGKQTAPHVETDPTGPLSAYGRSKLAGERAILASGLRKYFIVRTSWLYGPGGKNFVETILRLSTEREELRIVADQVGSPTYTGDLAQALFNLLGPPGGSAAAPYGIYHFANSGTCSWHEFAAAIVAAMRSRGASLRVQHILPIATCEYPLPAVRPAYSVFGTERYATACQTQIPHWTDGLSRYLNERPDPAAETTP